jgi:hypothetical protein
MRDGLKPETDSLQGFEEMRWSVIIQARIQMEQLAIRALQITSGSEFARAAIGEFLLAEIERPEELKIYGQERAALTILELAPRVLPKSLLACLVLGMTRIVTMPETARTILLEALEVLTSKWRKYGNPEGIAVPHQIVLEALELELRRPTNLQSVNYLANLCHFIARHPHTIYVPLLLLLSTEHSSLEVRKFINDALRTISESLELRWLSTRRDELADLPSRAIRLQELRTSYGDTSLCIQTIFNNMKGVPIESTADPRAIELKKLLRHQSMSVKIAVCWALYGEGSFQPEIDDLTGGITALASVAMNSLSPGLTRDALELLDRLQKEHPESQSRIDMATERASKKFLQLQTEPEKVEGPKSFVIKSSSSERR